jgi:ribose transport system substrate-binding protein
MKKKKLLVMAICFACAVLLPVSMCIAADMMVSNFTEMANDYYKNWHQGAGQAVEALGGDYKFGTNGGDATKHIAFLENYLSMGAKMFFIVTPDSGPVKTVAEMMQKEKAWMTMTWFTQNWMHPADIGDYYVAFYVPDDTALAYELAKALFDKMGKKGRLIHVGGTPGSTPEVRRNTGVDKALKEYPEIKLIARQAAKWNRNESRKIMESLIVAHPGFEGVFGQNDSVGIGALEACEGANIKVPVVGIDGADEALKLIKQGRFYATQTVYPAWQSGWAAVKVWDAAHGWKPSIPERMMFQAGKIVNKDNIDQYMEKFGGKKLPYDWNLMSVVKHPKDWDPQNLLWPIDLEYLTLTSLGIDKVPAGVKMNQQYLDAKAKGELEKIAKVYVDHYKKKVVY